MGFRLPAPGFGLPALKSYTAGAGPITTETDAEKPIGKLNLSCVADTLFGIH